VPTLKGGEYYSFSIAMIVAFVLLLRAEHKHGAVATKADVAVEGHRAMEGHDDLEGGRMRASGPAIQAPR
jgi:hypothetical protein